MLLRREPGLISGRFAERQKSSKLKAKLRQSFVIHQISAAASLSFGLDRRLAPRLRFRSKHPLPANDEKNSYTICGRARLISVFLDGRRTQLLATRRNDLRPSERGGPRDMPGQGVYP
jgi:hypothetical protein